MKKVWQVGMMCMVLSMGMSVSAIEDSKLVCEMPRYDATKKSEVEGIIGDKAYTAYQDETTGWWVYAIETNPEVWEERVVVYDPNETDENKWVRLDNKYVKAYKDWDSGQLSLFNDDIKREEKLDLEKYQIWQGGFVDSHDQKWGAMVKREHGSAYTNGRRDILFIKNNETGEIKQVQTELVIPYVLWLEDGTLLVQRKVTDYYKPEMIRYDPMTETSERIDSGHGARYLRGQGEIWYEDNGAQKLYNIQTKVIKTLTPQEIKEVELKSKPQVDDKTDIVPLPKDLDIDALMVLNLEQRRQGPVAQLTIGSKQVPLDFAYTSKGCQYVPVRNIMGLVPVQLEKVDAKTNKLSYKGKSLLLDASNSAIFEERAYVSSDGLKVLGIDCQVEYVGEKLQK
ncbi:MAG: hypothetical protein ACRCTE_10860 [Cellulosilyticaceae bacterium]